MLPSDLIDIYESYLLTGFLDVNGDRTYQVKGRVITRCTREHLYVGDRVIDIDHDGRIYFHQKRTALCYRKCTLHTKGFIAFIRADDELYISKQPTVPYRYEKDIKEQLGEGVLNYLIGTPIKFNGVTFYPVRNHDDIRIYHGDCYIRGFRYEPNDREGDNEYEMRSFLKRLHPMLLQYPFKNGDIRFERTLDLLFY